ncbi:nitroreductase family protein [Sphingomonas psychrotolerans]|uniref:Nitroreductase family protein n=1 Tax=Sphingomonas psychrotolerans TaxID=1327635 RepID=A0ABU3N2E8_9SPHN|nr:nitroreductase family protein [Sphingomonas psychrotolerans]MDT8758643.1 nitroreductase family protein [Sphingomonas psychrotolerans]
MRDPDALPWQPYPELSDAERVARARAFSDSMRSRRSCRAFSEEPVPREVIEAALAAAGSAPNGANRQPWHFCVVSSPEAKCAIRIAAEEEERAFYDGRAGSEWLEALVPLGTGADKPYLETAPWLIVVFAQRRGGPDLDNLKQNYYVTESVGLACGLLLATLHQAGVATLVHTPNPMRFLNRVCQRPDNEKPLMIIIAGHPAADAVIPAHALEKKSLEQIASWL